MLFSTSDTKVHKPTYHNTSLAIGKARRRKDHWTTSAPDSLLISGCFSVPGMPFQLGSVGEGTSQLAASEQSTLASLRSSCFSSELILIQAQTLGRACQLTLEAGLKQSSQPQPLTTAGVGGRGWRCTEFPRKRCDLKVVHNSLFLAVLDNFFVSVWLHQGF